MKRILIGTALACGLAALGWFVLSTTPDSEPHVALTVVAMALFGVAGKVGGKRFQWTRTHRRHGV